MTGRFVKHGRSVDDIVRKNVFYRLVEQRRDIYLRPFDYIFRYDPDWFWNVPETRLLQSVPALRAGEAGATARSTRSTSR